MNILETILNFITTLARVIFPRRKQPVAGDNLCPCPLPEADWLGLSGYTLMLSGGIASLYKAFLT